MYTTEPLCCTSGTQHCRATLLQFYKMLLWCATNKKIKHTKLHKIWLLFKTKWTIEQKNALVRKLRIRSVASDTNTISTSLSKTKQNKKGTKRLYKLEKEGILRYNNSRYPLHHWPAPLHAHTNCYTHTSSQIHNSFKCLFSIIYTIITRNEECTLSVRRWNRWK